MWWAKVEYYTQGLFTAHKIFGMSSFLACSTNKYVSYLVVVVVLLLLTTLHYLSSVPEHSRVQIDTVMSLCGGDKIVVGLFYVPRYSYEAML